MRLLSVAFVKTIGRRKAIRFVDELAAVVETELRVRKLMPARAREALAPQHAAQQEGAAMVQRLIPVLVAAIPRA